MDLKKINAVFIFPVLRLKMLLRLKVLQLHYHQYLPPSSFKRAFIIMGFGLCTTTPKRQIAGDNPLKFLTALLTPRSPRIYLFPEILRQRDKVKEGGGFNLQELPDINKQHKCLCPYVQTVGQKARWKNRLNEKISLRKNKGQ